MPLTAQRTCSGASCSAADTPLISAQSYPRHYRSSSRSSRAAALSHCNRSRAALSVISHRRRDVLVAAVDPNNEEFSERYSSLDADDERTFPFAEPPSSFELLQRDDRPKPIVRVRLSVHYRVHSRQMLCIGGSQIPFGWAFLSIAKVPMTWNTGDIWTLEVDLPAGQRVEYKYVILEEQDWTKQESEDAEGLVEINYRSHSDSGRPPDYQLIQKQMAIVAWQPGPNRVLQVPAEPELSQLREGDVIERIAPRRGQKVPYEATQRAQKPAPVRADPFEGTWEILSVDDKGRPFLDRHDVWGWVPTVPNPASSPVAGRPTIRSIFDRNG